MITLSAWRRGFVLSFAPKNQQGEKVCGWNPDWEDGLGLCHRVHHDESTQHPLLLAGFLSESARRRTVNIKCVWYRARNRARNRVQHKQTKRSSPASVPRNSGGTAPLQTHFYSILTLWSRVKRQRRHSLRARSALLCIICHKFRSSVVFLIFFLSKHSTFARKYAKRRPGLVTPVLPLITHSHCHRGGGAAVKCAAMQMNVTILSE